MTEPTMSEEEFVLLRRVVQAQTGISLGASKRALLEARLRKRVRQLGLSSFLAYYRLLRHDAPQDEFQRFVDLVTTNTSVLFREPVQLELFARAVVPEWERRAQEGRTRLRIWSAACSAGQEPYSLAAVLRSAEIAPPRFDLKILATDISDRALKLAREGIYSGAELEQVPAGWRTAFRRVPGASGKVRAEEALRDLVVFRHLNLLAPSYPFNGAFDAIFCRNVFIYFDEETKRTLLTRLIQHLAPGGYLFFGLSEALVRIPPELEALGTSTYRRRARGAHA